jgi:hypothetical protein
MNRFSIYNIDKKKSKTNGINKNWLKTFATCKIKLDF